MQDRSRLCRLENGERDGDTVEMRQASAVGRSRPGVAHAEAEEFSDFIVASTEAPGGVKPLNPRIGWMRPFTPRWSCSNRLFLYAPV
jgi:hypothetical protein